ncbi:MAG: hypothetical protein KF726_17895 [Anaerolineae bacterium]|nr:hypothetical protein [Anaerolineae bacterium]
MTKQARPLLLWLLAFCLLILGIGGFYGGINFLSDPTGASIGMAGDYLAKLPVPNYQLPGLFLLTVFGVLPLFLLYSLFARPKSEFLKPLTRSFHEHWAWVATLLLGLLVLGWMVVQVAYIGMSAPIQYVILILGVLIVGLDLLPSLRRYFEESSS